MSSKLSSPEKTGQNGDLVVNQSNKKITILGRDMSYKDLVNLVKSSLQISTSMDIAVCAVLSILHSPALGRSAR